jgi:hypothetical protein
MNVIAKIVLVLYHQTPIVSFQRVKKDQEILILNSVVMPVCPALPSVCPACHLSVRHFPLSFRHSIGIPTSVSFPCSHIWSSVRPSFLPSFLLESACHRLFVFVSVYDLLSVRPCILLALVSPYDRLSLSALVSPCYRLFTLVSACDCLSVLVPASYRVFAFVSVYDRFSVRPSIRILQRWIWHFWVQ